MFMQSHITHRSIYVVGGSQSWTVYFCVDILLFSVAILILEIEREAGLHVNTKAGGGVPSVCRGCKFTWKGNLVLRKFIFNFLILHLSLHIYSFAYLPVP